MSKFLKEKFGLTNSGIKSVEVASVASFFVNVSFMAFMMIAMYYGYNVLNGIKKSPLHYVIIIAIAIIISYIVVDLEYVKTFNTTYKEAERLRLEVADTIKELPVSYFSKHDLSDLSQTIMQDVLDIEHAMSHSMPRCIAYIAFTIVIGIMLLLSNVKLGLATVIPLIIGLLMMYVAKEAQKKWSEKYFWKNREHTDAFQETIELQREIKSYGLVAERLKKSSDFLHDMENLRLKSEMVIVFPMILSTNFIKLIIGIIAVVSSSMLKAGAVELIYVIGFILASIKLVDAIAAMEESFAELLFIDSRVKRINELRNTETQKGEDITIKSFDINLEDVEFAYDEDNKVISGVTFSAKQGEVTAIVGPSGCGKSTILRLVSRLYDYDSGKILIDGHDVKDVSTDALYDKISFVFQDVILFNASVLDNIRIGRPTATDEEVMEAARMAHCDEFVRKLSDGYNTLIGENGSNLSGGERQRISIARAFLKNAPILLLDEISASLDVENEREIQKSLNELVEGKTVIIISHRLKSIEKVDKIVVMDEGKIDSIGTHTELLEKSDLYRRLLEKSSLTEEFTY